MVSIHKWQFFNNILENNLLKFGKMKKKKAQK